MGRLGSGPVFGPVFGPPVMRRRAWLLWIAAPAFAQQAEAEAEVDANTASRAQLESLPGLGPALVQRLLAARPFADWADLMKRVPGIRAATARKLSAAGLRVGTQPYGD
jgi:competence protein ComEA